MAILGYAALSGVISSDPFKDMAAKAGSWATDRAFGLLDAYTPEMVRSMGDTLASFRFDPTLPVNHDIERGVTRATLLATLHCLAALDPDARVAVSDDPSQERPAESWGKRILSLLRKAPARTVLGAKPPPYPSQNYDHARAALRWYHGYARRLRHDTGSKDARSHLIKETALPVGIPELERSGARQFVANNAPGVTNPASGPEAQNSPARSIEDTASVNSAVLDQIIAAGGWPDARKQAVRAALDEALFGKTRKWWLAFSLYYAEELNADPAFRQKLEALQDARITEQVEEISRTLKALVAGTLEKFEAISDAMRANHAEQMAALADLQKLLTLSAEEVFFEPKGNMTDDLSVQSFYFAEEEDAFIGREDAIAAIESRLLRLGPDTPGFAWAAITGSAGSGKSRLALQLRNRNRENWPFSGFVRAQFLSNMAPQSLKPGVFTLPTLFILDYAGGNPRKCAEFLAQCAAIADACTAPVRALVLVRQTTDSFFEESRRFGDGSRVLHTRENFEGLPNSAELHIDKKNRALELQPLSDNDLVELMHRRMVKTHALLRADEPDSPPPRKDPASLLKLLQDYDPVKKRALIALLLADARQRGTLGQADDEDTHESRLSRLLQDHLKWQFEVRWRKPPETLDGSHEDMKDLIDRHLSFLILATCCRVFTDETWDALLAQPQVRKPIDALLPLMECERSTDTSRNFFVLNREILENMSAQRYEVSGDKPYPILEPDLFGEALLLQVLGPRGDELALRPSHADLRRSSLVDLAWMAMPEGMAGFIALIEPDFPRALKELGWCLPTEINDRNRSAIAELVRYLILNRLEAFFVDQPTKKEFEEIDRLLQLVPIDETDPDSLQHVMTMRTEVAGDLSAMINSNGSKKREIKGISSAFSEEGGLEATDGDHARRAQSQARHSEQQTGKSGITSFVHTQLAKRSVRRSREGILLPASAEDWDACRALLRSIADGFEQFLFSDLPLDIRDDYLDALGYMITAMLWNDRADPEKGGRDTIPLSDGDLVLRDHIAARAEAKLRKAAVSHDDAGLACLVLSRIIYAEWGSEPTRGDLPGRALARIASGADLLHPVTIRSLISSATNVHYLTAAVGANADQAELARREAAGRALLEDARKLLTRLDREPAADVRRAIIANYSDLLARQADTWNRAGWPRDAHLFLTDYAAFLSAWPGVKAGQDVLVFLAQVISAEALKDVADKIGSDFINSLLANGFDPEKNRPSDWSNLSYILSTFSIARDSEWKLLRPLVVRLLDDLGEVARDALHDQLRAPMQDPDRDGLRTLDLLELLIQRTAEPWKDRKLADPLLAAAGRALLEGHDERVWNLASSMAGDETEQAASGVRAVGLEIMELLLTWAAPDDVRASNWIARFFDDLTATSASAAAAPIIGLAGHVAVAGMLRTILRREAGAFPPAHWLRFARRQGVPYEHLRAALAPTLEQLVEGESAPGCMTFARYSAWRDVLGAPEPADRLLARSADAVGRMLLRADDQSAQAYLAALRREGEDNANILAQTAYLRGLELAVRWIGPNDSADHPLVAAAREAVAAAPDNAAEAPGITSLKAALAATQPPGDQP